MTDLPKPSVIQISAWQKEWYSLRSPTMTKEEFLKGKLKDWYRYQWHIRNQ
jgi:hypothetical protein